MPRGEATTSQRVKRERPKQDDFELSDIKQEPQDNQRTTHEKAKKHVKLEPSGLLAEETNMKNGVVIKHSMPPEARRSPRVWSLFVFKGDTEQKVISLAGAKAFLIGKDMRVVDILMQHQTVSKQHAVIVYRQQSEGDIRPYIMDLCSTNGTFLNGERIEDRRYYELRPKDILRFARSTREYVVLPRDLAEPEGVSIREVVDKRLNEERTGQAERARELKYEGGETPKTVTKRRKRPTYTEAHFEPINTWWDKPLRRKDDPQWTYLEHSGLMFYPPYKPHNVPMDYDGHEIHLPPPTEEVANFWCSAQSSEYPKKQRFVANFWSAFLRSLPEDHPLRTGNFEKLEQSNEFNERKRRKTEKSKLAKFESANFDHIREYLEATKEAEKQARKNMDKAQREQDRLERLKIDGSYMYALHDGIREKVAIYKAEVPGLFRGRGEHPKMGRLKRRIFPDEVSLNLSEDAPVPRLPSWMKGHSWQDVFHDNSVTWLAYYRDTVNSSFKYVFLGASSAVKGMKDYLKYELARRLKDSIDSIRQDYTSKMKSSELPEKQLGTAAYVIDALALRVGNEKDREEEADTVGCCSLRREHITAMDDVNHTITLDFLGKDSIRYLNTVTLNPLAYKNVKNFCKNKKPNSSLFDTVSTGILNKYLRDLMPGLSAKVFRTYNASITLQKELAASDEPNSDVDMTNIEDAKRFYEHCNRQVAILCNHQRTIPKQHNVSMEKLQKQYKWLEEDLEEIKAFVKHLRSNKADTERFVWDGASARDADDLPRVSVAKPNMREEAACRKLKHLEDKQVTLGLRIRVKDENKAVSNNTSKQHYMDPRITVTFCKKFDLPIEKFFNSSLLKKFPWAMYAKSDFVTSSLLFLVLSILIGSLSRWILTSIRGFKPPVSVVWFVLGIIITILEISISHQRRYHGESILDENEDASFAKFSFGIAQFARLKPENAYFTLLPILLYDATQQQSWYYFKRVLSSGLILATAGILIQIAFLSVLVRYTFPGFDANSDQAVQHSRSLFSHHYLPSISTLPTNFLQIEKLQTSNTYAHKNLTNATILNMNYDRILSDVEPKDLFLPAQRAWRFALLTATTVSSTDPIAVISVLEEMDAPHKFSALVDCEALINDGTALFVYSFLKEIFASGRVTFGKALWMFLRLSCLGPMIGFLWAAIVYRWLIRFQGHPLEQTLVVVCNGYGIYLITEVFLRSSGPLTIVVYGLYFSAFAKAALDSETRKVHKYFVSTLATGANMVIFVMSGCVCGRMIWDGFTNQKNLVILENENEYDLSSGLSTPSGGTKVGYMIVFYIYVQLARLIMLLIVAPILKKFLSQYTWKEFILLFWSGLRGGVCLLTAMQVEDSKILGNADLRQSATYSTSAALLILMFNATTFSTIYRKLQPYKPNSFRVAYLKKVMALIEMEYVAESKMLHKHWLFSNSSVLTFADKLIPKLDSVVMDKMGLAELGLVDVRKVFNQWSKSELQEAWNPQHERASSPLIKVHEPSNEDGEFWDYKSATGCSVSNDLLKQILSNQDQTPTVEKNPHRGHDKSSISLYIGKEGWGMPDNAYSARKLSDFETPLDLELADNAVDRSPQHERAKRKEREREMLLIMVNAMRHLYQELYARSFISGTVMKDFSSVADIVSDFAMINFDNTHEKGKWKKCVTSLMKGQRAEKTTLNNNLQCEDAEKSIGDQDWELFIEKITGFELEWGTLETFLRGRSEPGRIRRFFCCFTSVCNRQNLDSPLAECVFRLVNWFGPRQTFRALDELQMVVACADVHDEILMRGGPQLDEMLGTTLTRSCKDVVTRAKLSVHAIANQFYKTFPYAMICHAAVCLGNLKIQLLQTHLQRGLLLNDDNDKMACVMKKQMLRIRRFRPPYAMH